MQVSLNSDVVSYDLTDQEVQDGVQLNYLQKAVLQNERVAIIYQLASLTPENMTPEKQQSFWQQEAYLRGQLDLITHFIAKSAAADKQANPSNNSSEES